MTEQQWLNAGDPELMLEDLFQLRSCSARKLRLLAAACCRRFWHLMGEPTAPRVIDDAESFADGEVGDWKRRHIRSQLQPQVRHSGAWDAGQALVDLFDPTPGVAARECQQKIISFRFCFASEGLRNSEEYQAAKDRDEEKSRLSDLYRCIFGNPFRPVTIEPCWFSETVVALATGIYTDRAFDRLPILADALEEAGCDLPDILHHCRGDGPHVRGCWVVDVILNKS